MIPCAEDNDKTQVFCKCSSMPFSSLYLFKNLSDMLFFCI